MIVAAGVWLVPAQYVRDRGVAQQHRLWEQWGGAPTTARLRWSGATSATEMTRRHADVARATGLALPDEDSERRDPGLADEKYQAAVNLLRESTRGEAFGLLAKENRNYGFRRNLYGLRSLGLKIATAGLLIAVVLLIISLLTDHVSLWGASVATGFCFFCLVFWWQTVTPDWVRKAADRYAERLLAGASQLPAAPAGEPGSA